MCSRARDARRSQLTSHFPSGPTFQASPVAKRQIGDPVVRSYQAIQLVLAIHIDWPVLIRLHISSHTTIREEGRGYLYGRSRDQ